MKISFPLLVTIPPKRAIWIKLILFSCASNKNFLPAGPILSTTIYFFRDISLQRKAFCIQAKKQKTPIKK